MRLAKVHKGHALREKIILGLIRVVSRRAPPAVVRTLLYRPGFFGRRHRAMTHKVMRGPSDWSVGERELFAAYVSSLHRCVY